MHIDEILNSLKLTGTSTFTTDVAEDWSQGRTLFGGLQASLAVHAMRQLMPSAPPLLSLQTTFIGPVPPGKVQCEVSQLRSGRSATQMEARFIVDGESACVIVAVFGALRSSAIVVEPPKVVAPARSVEESTVLPFIQNVLPNFTAHYDYRWAEGGLPFSGSKVVGTRIHLRQRDEGELGEAQIVALCDAIPPPSLSLLDKPTPASTLTWTLEFIRPMPVIPSTHWWRMDARVISAGDGYSSQDASLYGPDGSLVALSRQMVAVFG